MNKIRLVYQGFEDAWCLWVACSVETILRFHMHFGAPHRQLLVAECSPQSKTV